MSGTSTKPYILRALYEWASDNGYTPYIAVWVDEHTTVPRQYVKNNEIVLNIGQSASHNLNIDNQWLSFSARFAGVAHDVWVPVGNVLSIFARETGQGMGFELEKAPDTVAPVLQAVPDQPQGEHAAADGATVTDAADNDKAGDGQGPDDPPPKPGGRPSLRIVK